MRLSQETSEDGEIVSATKDQHRFRSGKEGAITTAVSPTWCNSSIPQVELENLVLDASIDGVPRMCRKVEIQYSNSESKTLISGTFCVRPYPSVSSSRFYNKTAYSGLETHIPNSYTNLILQVTYYSFPTRKLARSHITKRAMRARVCRAYARRRTRNQSSVK